MPKPIYTFMTRGNQMGGAVRFEKREDAQHLYDELCEKLQEGKEFIELTLNEDKVMLRAKDLSSFGITVQLEETPEERKARALAQIERYGADTGEACASTIHYSQKVLGSGLI